MCHPTHSAMEWAFNGTNSRYLSKSHRIRDHRALSPAAHGDRLPGNHCISLCGSNPFRKVGAEQSFVFASTVAAGLESPVRCGCRTGVQFISIVVCCGPLSRWEPYSLFPCLLFTGSRNTCEEDFKLLPDSGKTAGKDSIGIAMRVLVFAEEARSKRL